MKEPLKISVVIPAYNMEKTIKETVLSVLGQDYSNFEVIVQDNDSTDKTALIVQSFADGRIKYFKNPKNLGYAKNLIEGWKNCSGDVLYYLGADDILSKHALSETNAAFSNDENVGAVTRPYFWFQSDIESPIRLTPCLNKAKNETVHINQFEKAIFAMHNEILGQLSGLAFRMKFLKENYFNGENDWIAHGYPFVNIFKNHPVVFLKNYQIAVRIGVNIIRQKGSIMYKISPTKRWMDMLNETLSEKKHRKFKKFFVEKVIASNYVGLVQIRCYSSFKNFLRETYYLLKYRWQNILSFQFWFFSLGCAVMPSFLLSRLVDWYKNRISAKLMQKITFEYELKKDNR